MSELQKLSACIKIAAKKEKDGDKNERGGLKTVGKAVGGLVGGTAVGHGLGVGAMGLDQLVKGKKAPSPHQIASEMKQKINFLLKGPAAAGLGLRNGKPVTVMYSQPSDSEAVRAHEIGHLKNHKVVGRKAIAFSRQHLGTLMGLTGPAAGLYSAVADDPSYIPAAVHLGLSSPTLLDEGLASLRAYRHMVGKYGLGTGSLRSLALLPAFASYAAPALAPAAIVALRRHLKKREAENK